MFDDIIRDNLSPEPSEENKIEQKKLDDFTNIGTKIYITLFKALKEECQKYECCDVKCLFYEKEVSGCLLKHCPCDYDLSRLEKAVFKAIEKEGAENE